MMRLGVALILLSLLSVAYAVDWLVDVPELGYPLYNSQNSEHSGYCYYVNDTPRPGKQSSTVEDRLSKNKKNHYYDPPLSRYLNVMSANEYLVNEQPNTDANYSQFVTQNSIGLKIPYAGVEAFFKQIRYAYNLGNHGEVKSYTVSQHGFGAGMPNADLFRAFAYLVQNDYSGLYPTDNKNSQYSGIKAQLAKRFRHGKQFTEIGVEYEGYNIPKDYYQESIGFISSYFTDSSLDWTPKTRINGYLIASNIGDRYMEPNNFKGLGSASSPMLLVRKTGYAFIARGIYEEREESFRSTRDTDVSVCLPLNISEYVGLDLGYRFNRHEDIVDNPSSSNQQHTTFVTKRNDFSGGLRFAVFNYDEFRLIGGAKYTRHKFSNTENIDFSANLIITISHHLALIGEFQHNNLWRPAVGAFRFDPLGFYYGSSLTVRL
ncbi:MAG: hypothetical protein PHY48_02105 [Candidatus Cloacimonetes bacterium]|nr:hypothetical protein [Candidatus Cloacimonadota bacterium]